MAWGFGSSIWRGGAEIAMPANGGGGERVRPARSNGPPGVDVVEVARYELGPQDRVQGRVQTAGGSRVGVVAADGRVILVPETGLVRSALAGAVAALPAVSASAERPPESAEDRRRRIALYAGVGLGFLTTAAAVAVGVIASKRADSGRDDASDASDARDDWP